MDIRIQNADFRMDEEYERLRRAGGGVGAIVTFTGLVRDLQGAERVEALVLEHYPGMTEKSLRAILDEAAARWPLLDATVIHRVGELAAAEQIVFVGVCSAHRQAAFEAAAYIMDYLKTAAPFWKKCRGPGGEHWVEAKESDEEAFRRWERPA